MQCSTNSRAGSSGMAEGEEDADPDADPPNDLPEPSRQLDRRPSRQAVSIAAKTEASSTVNASELHGPCYCMEMHCTGLCCSAVHCTAVVCSWPVHAVNGEINCSHVSTPIIDIVA